MKTKLYYVLLVIISFLLGSCNHTNMNGILVIDAAYLLSRNKDYKYKYEISSSNSSIYIRTYYYSNTKYYVGDTITIK